MSSQSTQLDLIDPRLVSKPEALFRQVSAVDLVWADSFLAVQPMLPELCLKLRMWYKSLKLVKFKRLSVGEYVPLHKVETSPTGPRIITFSGFYDMVFQWLSDNGYGIRSLRDIRLGFPAPDFSKLGGLRFSQADVVMAILTANRSCMVQCPTRYGKTHIMANVIRAYPNLYTVVCAPAYDICYQLYTELKVLIPGRRINILTSEQNTTEDKGPDWHPGKLPCDDVTVTTFQSLRHCYPEAVRLCLIDEVHTAAAPKTVEIVNTLVYARRFGFSATTSGRFDNADLLIQGLVGPLVKKITFDEAVAEKALLPIRVMAVSSVYPAPVVKTRQDGSEESVFAKTRAGQTKNWAVNHVDRLELWSKICNLVIPPDWQTLIFVDTEEHGKLLQTQIQNSVFVMARNFKNKTTREEFKLRMVRGDVRRCISTDIYGTGLTFPMLRAQINACGGGGSISATQKPGRLAGLLDGKTHGYLFEVFEDQNALPKDYRFLQNDSTARMNQYKKLKYDLLQFPNLDELAKNFAKLTK